MEIKTSEKRMLVMIGLLLASFLAVIIIFTAGYFVITKNGKLSPRQAILTEMEARVIAEEFCIKGGETLEVGIYNQNTKTWWFDANLNAGKEGCNPACVVSEETKAAEINWRCTGLKEPNSGKCGIENCHGLDIVCGPEPVEMCTAMYQFGDYCRQYAQCAVVNGVCRQIENPQFDECKSCVQKCQKDSTNDPAGAFDCENKCRE